MSNDLLQMQRELDNEIKKKMNLTELPLEKTKVALLVELGEFLNEMQASWKYWRKNPREDRILALEEYVDILHFALSITAQITDENFNIKLEELYHRDFYHFRVIEQLNLFNFYQLIFQNLQWNYPLKYSKLEYEIFATDLLYIILDLGVFFEFTYEDIEKAYIYKWEKNMMRTKNGY